MVMFFLSVVLWFVTGGGGVGDAWWVLGFAWMMGMGYSTLSI